MHPAIDINLAEISCISSNKSSWPDRVLFAIACKSADRGRVELVGPCWMLDGQSIAVEPNRNLFSAFDEESEVAIAIHGVDLGRKTDWEEDRLARELTVSAIEQVVAASGRPPGEGSAWDAGLDALEAGLRMLVQPHEGEPIFAFSKVYTPGLLPAEHALYHTHTDEGGGVRSRYKVSLCMERDGRRVVLAEGAPSKRAEAGVTRKESQIWRSAVPDISCDEGE